MKQDFPILSKITYLDSACMSLKPIQVVQAINKYYQEFPVCSGRSSYSLSQKLTTEINSARKKVSNFINSKSEEIIFTKNTTEGLNLLAHSLKEKKVLIGPREHNSNLIPWLKNRKVEVIEENKDHTINLNDFYKKIKNTEVLSLGWICNLDGYELPVKEMIKEAEKYNVITILDAAQAAPHIEINTKKLKVDYLTFSGHKILGPTGTGILYGKKENLENLEPFILGGGTVYESTYQDYQLEKVPARFEAGLQDYAGIIGLSAAIDYLNKIGFNKITKHSKELKQLMLEKSKEVEIIGVPETDISILNFNLPKVNPHDVARLLDTDNIAVRAGAHCVHSWYNKNKLTGSVRASAYIYNTKEDIEKLFESLKKIKKVLS